jgi:predicted GIY-YIG superfamily endonuclease
LEPYFKSIHTAEFINLIGSRLDLIPSICALDLLISEKIELDKRLRQVISLSRNFADSIISGNSKDIILQRLEKHINKVDYAQEFLDDKVSHELYILDEKKLKGTKSKALNQVKLTPTNQKSQLINQKGTLNTNNFTHEVLLQFPLLIRALNPSMMREVVLLSLKTGGVKHSENYMVFPFMADFLVTSGNKKLAIFVS